MSDDPCSCGHRHPRPGVCGALITEDIRVGDGPYDRRGRFYRSIVVDVCKCEADNV